MRDPSISLKTFGEDTYGRHALCEPGGSGDVTHLDDLKKVNPTRMPEFYTPRHAACPIPAPAQ